MSDPSLAKISIIIPVLNEAAILAQTIAALPSAKSIEIIVVDGGSQDNTPEIAKTLGVKIIKTEPGRATQMNAGALFATGEILLFLHSDTILPPNFGQWVLQSLSQPQTIAGAFQLKIDGLGVGLRVVEKLANARSRILGMPYGDQGIFLKRSTFEKIGGYPPLPIMEDFELMRQLKKMGPIDIVPVSVITSARRWQKLGVIKTSLINQLIIGAYFLGIPPHQIATWYRGNHRKKNYRGTYYGNRLGG
jgi:rSAM/selenodomain-associated transferase 2